MNIQKKIIWIGTALKIVEVLPALSIIVFAVGMRLLPHPPNFAPIAAMALFGGTYLNKRYALIVPLITMFASDIFLGFHNTILFVYGSFLLTGCIGLWLRRHKTYANVVFASLVSSLLFFFITNFGVWLMTDMYPNTLAGLMESYVMGVPFFRNTLFGDLVFTSMFFGSYELVQKLLLQHGYIQAKSGISH